MERPEREREVSVAKVECRKECSVGVSLPEVLAEWRGVGAGVWAALLLRIIPICNYSEFSQ
ncbi:hypothetical protein Syn6312_2887 [Synechococcus sp. PCC 6312]|nr:hypothetical protein Syn6312_2887 [Synechococcus sp. PCC 6312]